MPTQVNLATEGSVDADIAAALAGLGAGDGGTVPGESVSIIAYGAVQNTDCTVAIQAALDSGRTALVPLGTWNFTQLLINGHGRHLRLARGAVLVKTSSSAAGWGNAAVTNGPAFTATRVNSFRIDGSGTITTAVGAYGAMVVIYGDDQNYHDFTIDEWEDGLAFLVAGDRLRASNIKTLNARPAYNPNTGLVDRLGSGGFRYAGGKNSVVYGAHIVSGDDCYQAVPLQAAFAHPFVNMDIENLFYIGCTGRSIEARLFAVAISDQTVGSPGMTCNISNVYAVNMAGQGGARGIAIRNETPSTGYIHRIYAKNINLDQINAFGTHPEEVVITAQVGTGGVRGVYLDDVDVLNPKVRSLSANGPVEGLEINRGHWPVAPTANVGWDLSEAIDPLVNGSIFDGGGTANVILAGGGASVTGRPIFTNLQMLNIPAVANYNALNLNNAPGARVRGGKSTGGLAGVNCRAVRLGAGSTGVVIEDHDVAGLLGISQFSILADTIKRRNPGDDEADTADPAVTAAAVAAKIETINTKINTTGGAYTLPEGFNRHHITLTASASALTLPDAAPGTTIIVYLKQGSTGSRTATLVAAGDDVIFPTNYVPTLSTTVGRVDRLVLDCVVANEWMIEPVVQSVR